MQDALEKATLFDFQVNGFAGVDFQKPGLSAAEMALAVRGLRRHRTEAILCTLITDTIDSLCRKLEQIEQLRRNDSDIASVIRGYHIEGPWISTEPGYPGAHPAELACRASLADYKRLRDAANGSLKLITLAPEVDGCLEVIDAATADGIRISLGHTNANEQTIDAAIAAGATLATHLGNGVPAHVHRHDNVIQRLLARDELIGCFIPDGLHLPPNVLQNYYRAKLIPSTGECRAFFTTDCMSAAGAPPGRYTVGPHVVDVASDGIVRMPGDTRFAGSSLTLDRGVANIVAWLGLDVSDAIARCSTQPATHFGVQL